ncbi:N-acetyltransferase [Micromonospora echinofusca]|uniref:N-acetyltransferase n=1 Tax=Micromonospora echinofusca TaxID=47858 RepID=A0ABS3VXZ9_MICEH|nr:N-acetyltransferase [Micromonospora echinofusca]MBO4209414.1 N-acetyltransferase [Micromonospora echinofusca]
MTLTDTTICRATGDDIVALAELLADRLLAGPLGAWLVPDVAARRELLPSYAELVLAHAVEHGQADTTEDRAAVAVWYRRLEPGPPAAALLHDLGRLLGGHAARFAMFHAYVDVVRPHAPHHYLAHVAVASEDHERAASAMLAGHHGVLDAEGLPSYAELVSDRPREGLLARIGYEPRSPILLEPGGPALWRMCRPPSGAQRPGGLLRRMRMSRAVTPFRGRVIPAPTSRSS